MFNSAERGDFWIGRCVAGKNCQLGHFLEIQCSIKREEDAVKKNPVNQRTQRELTL